MTRQDGASLVLPRHREVYFGGGWHACGRHSSIIAPGDGRVLADAADADAGVVDQAVQAALAGFAVWRDFTPFERGDRLRAFAQLIRRNGEELAMVDAVNSGNPVAEMLRDIETSVRGIEYFAGLASEIKGETLPMGPDRLNYSTREPFGVVARIIAYNHPLMFATLRCAAPLAAGNSVIVKPAEQTPLSALRLAELLDAEEVFPAGVFNIVTGGRDCGAALVAHPGVARVSFIGGFPTGRAIMRSAAETVKSVSLELGGKNAFIAYPDMPASLIAAGAIKGMNLTWAGQSCGSTSRVFLHESHHDEVVELMVRACADYVPGDPGSHRTTMGALIDRRQLDKVAGLVQTARAEGATVAAGGTVVQPFGLEQGTYFAPTILTGVTQDMTIANEEVFGPVISVLKWSDEQQMLEQVNSVQYGLTAAIYTNNVSTAHRAARVIDAGYIWINNESSHFIGASFGGYKTSGIGREESLEELLECTQIKNVNVRLM